MKQPLISVVLPVYNAEDYLVDAIASILEQTLEDWEMICVDDGSSDRSGSILDWFANQDSRIRVIHQRNQGLVGALNVGIRHCRAPLVMRMDNDDIALPNRMQLQADFMRDHPNCVVVGGGILEMDSEGDPLCRSHLAEKHQAIVDNLLHRRTGHYHPTTMIRAEALRAVSGYRADYEWIEDHDLWLRLSRRGQLANIPEIVLCYRQHAKSICWQRSSEQRKLMNRLLVEAYACRGISIPPEVLRESSTQRSAAGPGKWARAAARGGFMATALKHLRELNRSNADWSYKARMNVETLARLGVILLSGKGANARSFSVPRFEPWHQRWQQSNGYQQFRRAA